MPTVTRSRSGSAGRVGEDHGESDTVFPSDNMNVNIIVPPGVPVIQSLSASPSHASRNALSQGLSQPLDSKPDAAFMAAKALELREKELELKAKELELERARLELERVSLMQAQPGLQNYYSSSIQQSMTRSQGGDLPPSGLALPKLEIQQFDGSALDYWGFKRAFEVNIANRVSDPAMRSSYLQHYCIGRARAAIKACSLMEPAAGYVEAWRILEVNFGRTHHVVQATLQKLLGGRAVGDDLDSLKTLAQIMRECYITMSQMSKLEYLDSTPNMLQLCGKFPKDLQARWGDEAGRIMEGGSEPTFKDLLEFVERRVFAMDNVYSIASSSASRVHQLQPPVGHVRSRIYNVVLDYKPGCAWCGNRGHGLGGCIGFSDAALAERREFIRKKKRCFVCLSDRHFAIDCKSTVKCTVNQCGGRHHTLLHVSSSPPTLISNANGCLSSSKVRVGFVSMIGTTLEAIEVESRSWKLSDGKVKQSDVERPGKLAMPDVEGVISSDRVLTKDSVSGKSDGHSDAILESVLAPAELVVSDGVKAREASEPSTVKVYPAFGRMERHCRLRLERTLAPVGLVSQTGTSTRNDGHEPVVGSFSANTPCCTATFGLSFADVASTSISPSNVNSAQSCGKNEIPNCETSTGVNSVIMEVTGACELEVGSKTSVSDDVFGAHQNHSGTLATAGYDTVLLPRKSQRFVKHRYEVGMPLKWFQGIRYVTNGINGTRIKRTVSDDADGVMFKHGNKPFTVCEISSDSRDTYLPTLEDVMQFNGNSVVTGVRHSDQVSFSCERKALHSRIYVNDVAFSCNLDHDGQSERFYLDISGEEGDRHGKQYNVKLQKFGNMMTQLTTTAIDAWLRGPAIYVH